VNAQALDVLRCPYCGGRLELVVSMYHRAAGDEISDGVLGCQCCIFPVVYCIPVLHLQPSSTTAREQIEAGQPELALRTMIGLDDEHQANRFQAAADSELSTYRDIVDALGPTFEGGYFLYRFSDPTYLVAHAVTRSVAGVILGGTGRAIAVCGGSGHLTRSLLDCSADPPVLADLYFAKVWLARRFTAPGCVPVCCDGNAPLPFARGAFQLAMCSDAFQYIWTKRQFIAEMSRLVDSSPRPGAVVINHTHNQLTWSPSHGQPLSPAGYADLFESIAPRIHAESRLLADVVAGGPLDLSRIDPAQALDDDPALTIIASRDPAVYRPHPIEPDPLRGEFRINPLYAVSDHGDRLHLRLEFPSPEYEDEYGACRRYLPQEAVIEREAASRLRSGRLTAELRDMLRRRVIVDLPKLYY